ncbi:right-handed parallel beta-helix repeat-containing protein [Candidatus Lokiarchaeum ossiferum]|uniref:right-handed parallel beta-helix repeat-containing protein n=1 Tax=Candidatus Lokiarchaeum ossiferum TaxID=2951803 RepID=UPI00352E7BC1
MRLNKILVVKKSSKIVLSKKTQIAILFGIIILLSWFLTKNTVEINGELKNKREFGLTPSENFNNLINQVNSTFIIDRETNFSEIAESGDGKSWETAYLINSTRFEFENSQSGLVFNNSQSYINIQNSRFDFRGNSNIFLNNSGMYLICMINSSNIRFNQCDISGYYFQDGDIGLYLNNCSNIIVENSNFGSDFTHTLFIESSQGVLFSNNLFQYGEKASRFIDTTELTFFNNLFFGKSSPLLSSDEYYIPGDYALEIFNCQNWTIKRNQIEYFHSGFFIDKCENFFIEDNFFSALDWSGLEVWKSNEIFIVNNIFSYNHVYLRDVSVCEIRGNRFYYGEQAIRPHRTDFLEITENRFYYVNDFCISLAKSSSDFNAHTTINKNIFVECSTPIELLNDAQATQSYNLFLGGVQDLWSGVALCYILYLIYNFMLKDELLSKVSLKYKLTKERSLSKLDGLNKKNSPSRQTRGEINNPDQIIENIRKIAKSDFVWNSGLLMLSFMGFILIGWFGIFRRSFQIRILEPLNGAPLYNFLYLDEKLFILTTILLSILFAYKGYKLHSNSLKSLRKIIMITEISHTESVRRFIPLGLPFLGFWYTFLALVKTAGNWKLFLLMLFFVFSMTIVILIKRRKYQKDVMRFYEK